MVPVPVRLTMVMVSAAFGALLLMVVTPTTATASSDFVYYDVANEAQYRDALTTASSATSGHQVIRLTSNFSLSNPSNASDPTYSGSRPLTIDGQGYGVTYQPIHPSRFLTTTGGATFPELTLVNLQVTGFDDNGAVQSLATGNVYVRSSVFADNKAVTGGPAVYANGSLRVYFSAFTGNSAQFAGGAIYSDKDVLVVKSTFEGNSSQSLGGAFYSELPAVVTLSTFEGNEADRGGAIYAADGLEIFGTTFNGNSADDGGGAVWVTGGPSPWILRSTFSNNTTASDGSAIYAEDDLFIGTSTFHGNAAVGEGTVSVVGGMVKLSNSTFTHNTAELAAGLYAYTATVQMSHVTMTHATTTSPGSHMVLDGPTTPSLYLRASVFSNASQTGCVVGTVYSWGYTFDGDASCTDGRSGPSDIGAGDNPGLVSLGSHGGPTDTRPPASSSALNNHIPLAECSDAVPRDQRGLPRPQGSGCEPGAVERAGQQFSDVAGSHPFVTEIGWLVGSSITTGYGDGTFRPTAPVTRQAIAAFLYRFKEASGFTAPATPSFTDVPPSHPFYEEIEWMVAQGIATGYGDGTFRPTATVSRQAASAFITRLEILNPPAHPFMQVFTDVPPDHPFAGEIEVMVTQGIAGGYQDGTFRPSAPVTRQALAAFLQRFMLIQTYDEFNWSFG